MAEFGEPLSERELEVLNCLAQGSGNKEIAAELHISGNTVKVHLRNVYTKLGTSSRTEATAVALQQGLITLPGMEALAPVPVVEVTAPNPSESEVVEAEPEPEPERFWFNRRLALVMGLVVVLILLLGISFFAVRQSVLTAVTSTPDLFEPPVVGENWKSLRPLPQPRAGMAAAAVGLNVYLVGGETAEGVDGQVWVYHTTNHTWQEAAHKETAVTDASAAELFGEIYVPGGRLADGRPTDIVEAYSPTNDTWRAVVPLPEAIAGALTLTDGSFLYVLGGWNGRDYLQSAYVYDPGVGEWHRLPDMSHPRANLMGGTMTGDLYAVGGSDSEGDLPVCEYYDLTEETWHDCPDMLSARSGGGAVAIVNKLYVLGGHETDNPTTFGEFFNPDTNEWRNSESVEFLENSTLAATAVTHVETGIFVMGGQGAAGKMAGSYLYAPLVYNTYLPAAPASGE